MRNEVLAQLNVSRETTERLDSYVHLLETWQRSFNLISPTTISEVWHRHIQDCAQLATLFPSKTQWLDLGSGAGLPGLVVAMIRAEKQPDFKIKLIESNGKKCAFMREAIRMCQIRADVIGGRIEDAIQSAQVSGSQVITARALASVDRLLAYCAPLLQKGAKAVFMKGATVETELTAASKSWTIEHEFVPSITEPGAKLLLVHSARRRLS